MGINISTKELSLLTGINYKTLNDWAEREIITSDLPNGAKRKTPTRRWGIIGIRKAWLANHLITWLGIDRWKVKAFFDKIDFTMDDKVVLFVSSLVTFEIYLDSMNMDIYRAMVDNNLREP